MEARKTFWSSEFTIDPLVLLMMIYLYDSVCVLYEIVGQLHGSLAIFHVNEG